MSSLFFYEDLVTDVNMMIIDHKHDILLKVEQ